jgi:uncharacterized protein YndB with AHSA1/START domain
MSIKKDATGRRSIQVEVEVPGTPEEVWKAIATGPGVSSWFVPTESEEREGGTITSRFGPGMDSVATITAWDAPRRFAAESDGFGPNAPALATEWFVEARSGGTCIVRVVHSLFASTDDWDDQLGSIETGWGTFFKILRLYLTDFKGQPCTIFQLMGARGGTKLEAWNALLTSLGLSKAAVGQRWNTPAGVPSLAGTVMAIAEEGPDELLRLEQPEPGVAFMNACSMGEQVLVNISFYLYGACAAATATQVQPQWEAWIQQHFPMPASPSEAG